jgi:tRNA-binding protein
MNTVTIEDFTAIEICTGTVLTCEPFPEGRFSSHILTIDFGETIGIKKSLARLTPHYDDFATLVGIQVLAVVNFPPRQIGKHKSECLTLGVHDSDGNVVLIRPEHTVPDGEKLC